MKVYDYKKTTPVLWCLVLCMSFFGLTLSAQIPDMSCASQVNVSIGEDCLLNLNPGLFTEGTETWDGVGTVTFSSKPPVSGIIGEDNTVDIECGMYTFTVNASGNSCWGTVKIEDKLPPVPPDVFCLDENGQILTDELNSRDNPCFSNCLSVYQDFLNLLSANDYFNTENWIECTDEIVFLGDDNSNDGAPRWFVKEILTTENCPEVLEIAFIINFKDGKGNKGSDTIFYEVEDLDALQLKRPNNYIGLCTEYSADGSTITPAILESKQAGSGLPRYAGELLSGLNFTRYQQGGFWGGDLSACNLLISYWDVKQLYACTDIVSDCNGTKQIMREWTVIDWCDGEVPDLGTQAIQLQDKEGPMVYGQTLDESTDPWKCAAEFSVSIKAEDNCADVSDLTYALFGPEGVSITGGGLGKPNFEIKHLHPTYEDGPAEFLVQVTDCCGNIGEAYIYVNVHDHVKPFAIAKEFTVASVIEINEDADEDGYPDAIAKVFYNSIDNGSWDACSDLTYYVRREDGDPRDCDTKDFFPYGYGKADSYYCGYKNGITRANAIAWSYDVVEHNTIPSEYAMNVSLVAGLVSADDFVPGIDCSNSNPENKYGKIQYNGDEWGEYVKFCCDDFGAGDDVDGDGYANEYRVELIVFDHYGNWNITWGWVKIEDPNPPILVTPPYEAYCHDEVLNGPLTTAISRIAEDALELVYAYGTCGQDFTPEQGTPTNIWYDPTCKYGSFDIPYSVKGFKGSIVRGVQTVYIYYKDNFSCDNIHGWTLDYSDDWYGDADNYDFRDNLSAECDPIDPPALTWEAGPCELIGWTLKTDTFYFETDACRKIINEWTVIDWCVYDTRNNGEKKDFLREHWYEYQHVFVAATSKFGSSHDNDPRDYCDSDFYWQRNGDLHNYYYYPRRSPYYDDEDYEDYWDWVNVPNWKDGIYKSTQLIKVAEDDAPVIDPFPMDMKIDSFLADCGRDLTLNLSASDMGECPADWLKWDLFEIDKLGGVVIGKYAPKGHGLKASLNPTWTNIEPADGSKTTRYYRAKAWDGCGNVDIYEFKWQINDKKDPTPYCINLSTALMVDPDGDGPLVPMVELWACDFDQGSYDNCTPDWKLFFTFDGVPPSVATIKIGSTNYYLPDHIQYYSANGLLAWDRDQNFTDNKTDWRNPTGGAMNSGVLADIIEAYVTGTDYEGAEVYKWLPRGASECGKYTAGKVYTEDELANGDTDDDGNVDVQMDVWDECLNVDYCSVQLTLRCATCGTGGSVASVAGSISTEAGNDVSGVEVTLDNLTNPEYTLTDVTGNDGAYAFASNPMYNGYDITGIKSGDDDEGVSTLDLVMIQRHILGLASFTSPYKVIASDINNNGDVSAADLIVLRKVILGLYKEFPQNESWRFVDAGQSLTVENALETFSEVLNIAELDANMLNENFVAVKIGDVNGDARTNARTAPQVRNANKIALSIEDRNVRAGEVVDITFNGSEFNQVYGYQFTIELNGLQFEAVKAGAANMTDENVALLDANTLTVSYADINGLNASDNIFTLSVVANRAGAISEMIDINSSTLTSEAYLGTSLDIATVELTLEGQEVGAFELGQNEPNPFNDFTVVGFTLPEAGDAQITVYDVAGKVITSRFGAYAKGYNTERFMKNELGVSGVLYYTLESGDFTATKKMIIIE